jgi:hypothetical protein
VNPHAYTPGTADLEPLPLPPPAPAPTRCGTTTYFKRYRMEIDLATAAAPQWPAGLTCVPWSPVLLDAHAEALCASFHGEIDAVVFSGLGSREGCRSLMTTIVGKSGFVPEATWLLVGEGGPCGSVQGLRDRGGKGAIQNLGIAPGCRGRGLGGLLLMQALDGFRRAGLAVAYLEVTARNERAEQLYRRLGFRRVKTLYKAVPAGGVG